MVFLFGGGFLVVCVYVGDAFVCSLEVGVYVTYGSV